MIPDDLTFDEKTKCWYSPSAGHLTTIREPPREYAALEPGPADVVLDIGAHVGGFLCWAYSRGCREITSVEPAADTYEVLSKNAEGKEGMIVCYRAAAVADPAPNEITLFTTKNHKTASSSMATVVETRGRDGVTVPALSFRELIRVARPNVIKMDIEGGEFLLDWTDLPDHVKRIAIELHHMGKNAAKASAIGDALDSQGFKEVITGRRGVGFREKKGWFVQAVFVRP